MLLLTFRTENAAPSRLSARSSRIFLKAQITCRAPLQTVLFNLQMHIFLAGKSSTETDTADSSHPAGLLG